MQHFRNGKNKQPKKWGWDVVNNTKMFAAGYWISSICVFVCMCTGMRIMHHHISCIQQLGNSRHEVCLETDSFSSCGWGGKRKRKLKLNASLLSPHNLINYENFKYSYGDYYYICKWNETNI